MTETPQGAAPEQLPAPDEATYDDYEDYDSYDGYADGWDDFGGACCGSGCGSGCGSCCGSCGPPGLFWARAEYLLWWTRGMETPPLVTTSPDGTPLSDAGRIGQPGTRILFGDENLFREVRSGARIRFGMWFDCCQTCGVEADFLALGNNSEQFAARSEGGDPIVMRPFYNTETDANDAEIVGYPGVMEGAVGVDASSDFYSAGIRWRCNLCCQEIDCLPACCGGGCFSYLPQGQTRVDFLFGYRYMQLDEDLTIGEDLNSLLPGTDTQFRLFDRFDTETEFHGIDLGLVYEYHRCRWSFEMLGRLAIGNNRQRVMVDGGTEITTDGIPEEFIGGIFAQRTNIGTYTRDRFAVIPEIGVTLGYRVTNKLRLTAGYTFIYWNSVIRPGKQIDPVVNENLIPPEVVPFSGPLRPRFAFRESSFWAQWLNFGAQLNF